MYSDDVLRAACREPIDEDSVVVTCSVCGEDAHEECVEWVPSTLQARWLDPDEEMPVCRACIEAAEDRRVVGL